MPFSSCEESRPRCKEVDGEVQVSSAHVESWRLQFRGLRARAPERVSVQRCVGGQLGCVFWRTSRNCDEGRERVRGGGTLGVGHLTQEGRLADRGEADQDGAAEAGLGDVEAGAGLGRAAGRALKEFGAVAREFGFQEAEVVLRRLVAATVNRNPLVSYPCAQSLVPRVWEREP